MQDPKTMAFQSIQQPQFPVQEQLKCPRCDSTNTKFCYYNNYNLSQPRHFCKNCRRYWTKGGALRNIPVGGGTRKNSKRNPNTKRANPDSNAEPERAVRQQLDKGSELGQDPTRNQEEKVAGVGGPGTFSSLLMTNGEFRSVFDGVNPNGSAFKLIQMNGFDQDMNSGHKSDPGRSKKSDGGTGYLQSDDWSGGSNGWPDLAIYTTPGSDFP